DCGCKPREHSAQRAPGCMDARPRRCSAWVTQRPPSVAFLATPLSAARRVADNLLFDNTAPCCCLATATGTSLALRLGDAGLSATRMLHHRTMKGSNAKRSAKEILMTKLRGKLYPLALWAA